MKNGSQTSTGTAVGGGVLAGLVVCVGCLLPMWLAGVGRGERGFDVVGGWMVPMLGLWGGASAGGGSFSFGSTAWTAARAAILSFFASFLVIFGLVIILDAGLRVDPSPWQWLMLVACVVVSGGAYLGVVVARREFSTASESAVLGDDESEEPHVERRFDWGKISRVISRVCGTLGLLLVLLVSASRQRSAEGGFYAVVFFLFPGLLLSTVAIVVGLWTRAGRGWIVGLVAWLWFLAWGYLR